MIILGLALVLGLGAQTPEPSPPLPSLEFQALPERPAEKPKAPRLLVLDLVDEGAGAALTAAISAAVQTQAVASHKGEVATSREIRAALDAAAQASLVGCQSADCAVDVANRMEAERVLAGSVTKVGQSVVINLVVVSARDASRVAERSRKVPVHKDLYYYAAKQLTALALTGKAVDERVPLRVIASADEAEIEASIFLDGRELGTTPMTINADPGDHEVRVVLEGYAEWTTRVKVEEANPLELQAQLNKEGVSLWPATLISSTVALLAAGGAGVLAVVAQDRFNGSVGLFNSRENSYVGLAPASSSELAEKRQEVQRFSVAADTLWVVTGLATTTAIAFFVADLATE